jgi:ABC-type histidine transport system ATPase subunit
MSIVMTAIRREPFASAMLRGVSWSARSGTVLRTSGASGDGGKHGGGGFRSGGGGGRSN